ncbi:putative Ig domain-containing protein, partial [Klebsiella pneumoniae]|uniref:putative Ig domain-containing protein n=1 Tax=Klebsiella pneumoniae TaxID=573 RepID=UPI0034D684A7
MTVTPLPTASVSTGPYTFRTGAAITPIIPTPTNTIGSVSWSSVGSALPAGLSVNASTGSLTGT